MRKEHIKAMWESYLKQIVPDDAHETQIEETRRAFYAGAAILYTGIMNMLDESANDTQGDIDLMEDLAHEIHAFGQEFDKHIFNIPEH